MDIETYLEYYEWSSFFKLLAAMMIGYYIGKPLRGKQRNVSITHNITVNLKSGSVKEAEQLAQVVKDSIEDTYKNLK